MTTSAWLVRLSTSALEQADQIEAWWKTERPAAPHLFRDELNAACCRLETSPGLGAEVHCPDGSILRRLLLRRTGYHLYYAVSEAHRSVTVHSIWHARRGRGPSTVRERSPVMAWRGLPAAARA